MHADRLLTVSCCTAVLPYLSRGQSQAWGWRKQTPRGHEPCSAASLASTGCQPAHHTPHTSDAHQHVLFSLSPDPCGIPKNLRVCVFQPCPSLDVRVCWCCRHAGCSVMPTSCQTSSVHTIACVNMLWYGMYTEQPWYGTFMCGSRLPCRNRRQQAIVGLTPPWFHSQTGPGRHPLHPLPPAGCACVS